MNILRQEFFKISNLIFWLNFYQKAKNFCLQVPFQRLANLFIKYFVKKIFLILAILFCKNAVAQEQIIDSSFYRFTVYEVQDELDYKRCYIAAYPISSDSNHNSRKKPKLMITRFQKDRSEEISIFGGFEYKLGSEIFLMIDNALFKMKTKDDMAWAPTKYDDIAIIQGLLKGAILRVRSNSALGTFAIDEYSLKGITRAYERMREICK